MITRYLGLNLAGFHKFVHKTRPFGAQSIRTGERAVSADCHDTIDAQLNKVLDRLAPP